MTFIPNSTADSSPDVVYNLYTIRTEDGHYTRGHKFTVLEENDCKLTVTDGVREPFIVDLIEVTYTKPKDILLG